MTRDIATSNVRYYNRCIFSEQLTMETIATRLASQVSS